MLLSSRGVSNELDARKPGAPCDRADHSINSPILFGIFGKSEKRLTVMTEINKRVLSIQSTVVHGYAGGRSAVFPLQLHGFVPSSQSQINGRKLMLFIPSSFQIIRVYG